MDFSDRPGVTSRIRPAPGRKRRWNAGGGTTFPLPVIVDHMLVDPETLELVYRIEAKVDLVGEEPTLVGVHVQAPPGLDLVRLQREFLWASPLALVTRGVPKLLAQGIDPFDYALPVGGFPDAADLGRPRQERLSDAFLEDIAREYLSRGRGYAKAIAQERHVSPRTVVSWVEKARSRGILTRVPQGGIGGSLVPKSRRGGV